VDSDGEELRDYSNIEPWHNTKALWWWVAGKSNLPDYVEEAGEVTDDRENEGIYHDLRERAGLYWDDTDHYVSDSDDCEGD
jgi:hypothetical protein